MAIYIKLNAPALSNWAISFQNLLRQAVFHCAALKFSLFVVDPTLSVNVEVPDAVPAAALKCLVTTFGNVPSKLMAPSEKVALLYQ